jgi:glycosyltransferase involved in cell wall biosynthesis
MFAVSIVICAHNPRPAALRRVLCGLRHQTLPKACFEIILVDNASREPLADRFDLSWHPNGRHVREPQLGLAAARRCGMREASSAILLFVDDDNVLAPDYLETGLRIGQEFSQLGTWGSGATRPEYESPPAERLTPLLPLLALRDVKEPHWTNVFQNEACPWGAGLFLRRSVADAYQALSRDDRLPLSDRMGAALSSGGDAELSFVACGLGLGMGIFPSLRLVHLIPKERVAAAYLMRLHEAIALSTRLMFFKWRNVLPRRRPAIRRALELLKNLVTLSDIQRSMYLADLRAERQFREIIATLRHTDSALACIGADGSSAE